LLQYVVVPEAKHMPAEGFEIIGSSGVAAITMLAAVRFDHKFAFNAGEVSDAEPDRFLLSELEPAQTAVSQVMPKAPFRFRCLAPDSAGMRVRLADGCHASS